MGSPESPSTKQAVGEDFEAIYPLTCIDSLSSSSEQVPLVGGEIPSVVWKSISGFSWPFPQRP